MSVENGIMFIVGLLILSAAIGSLANPGWGYVALGSGTILLTIINAGKD